ncbi:hypothetical protein KAR91_01920 [Candidatus Pacearchaeota archaeon]|nr:hypothetical protein [Candidatus Pacearchaeota archaeon]
MSWGLVAVAGATLAGGYLTSEAQREAGGEAAAAQTEAAGLGIEERRGQFERIQELLSPYMEAGAGALGGQQALLGLAGPEAQQQAISRIEGSPLFGSLVRQGEEGILQSASATGGLRGGNVQGALAQFRPQMLQQLIESQYSKLGGLSQLGQASAAGVGAAGQQTGAGIANLLAQRGQAQAGGALARGEARAGLYGDISQAIGTGIGGYLDRPINEGEF